MSPPAASGAVRICGIRHHGPGSARALASVLRDAPPDVVLVEGPAEAASITALCADPEMHPPVAMLGYVPDQPERAAFFPYASFSPEWVAIRWAVDHDVPVRWIDLPLRHQLAPEPNGAQGSLVPSGELDATTGRRRVLDPLGELATAAGYDDAERWWEDVLEHRVREGGRDPFEAVAEAMVAVRAELEPGGAPADPIEARREAAMRTGIRAALAEGFERVLVVCGAWHVPALLDATAARWTKHDKALLAKLPKVKAAITWVPWTHRRLATSTGYGAGVTAPGWYDHLFAHPGPDVIARWFAEAARILRNADHGTSPADVVDATRLADALAALRGRPLPGLEEVDDVARAVLGGGGDAPMRLLSRDLVIGAHIGSVPSSTPMVPLARDLATEQRRARLKPESGARTLELDLRGPLDLGRSRLLHRLALLGVPWGVETEGRGSTGTFRETWHLQWEPELDVRIIERAALGTTVVAAVSAAVGQQAVVAESLAELTTLLERALLAGLDHLLGELVSRVADRSAVADDVGRLLDSLGPLARTIRYGDVRGTDASSLGAVVHGIVGRIGAGLAAACSALDDDGAAAMSTRLRDARAAVALLGDERERDRFDEALASLLDVARLHRRVQGTASRMLADASRLAPAEVERRLSRALSHGEAPLDAAAFVEGFLGGSGAVLVHDPLLLDVVDRWVASLAADDFTQTLPLLRRTFGAFDSAERRAIGERVRTGVAPGGRRSRFDLDPDRAAAGLATMAHLLGLGA